MAFGLLMFLGTLRFLALDWVDDHYIRPMFHFRYFGFSWVPVFPAWALYAIHFGMLLSALLFISGYRFRLAALGLFLGFTYTELIDLTYYLNHYYFVSLACLLFCLAPIPGKTAENQTVGMVPAWTILMFKVLLTIVYVYAGLAKINSDWLLEALPLKIWLPAADKIPVIGQILAAPPTAYFFSWCGMLYDCLIVFFLTRQTTRPFAYITVLFFHLITGILFQIGVFPAVMMAATLIFFSDDFHERILKKLKSFSPDFLFDFKQNLSYKPLVFENLTLGCLGLFFLFQILFPCRYLLYPGNLFWTEEGYRFSWRVMLMEKAGTAQFFVKDGVSGREGLVNNGDFLNQHQEKQMAMQPDMILQYAHFLGDYYQKKGVKKPKVRAEVYVTLNGKPSRLLIDDTLDLMKVEDEWKPKTWILSNED